MLLPRRCLARRPAAALGVCSTAVVVERIGLGTDCPYSEANHSHRGAERSQQREQLSMCPAYVMVAAVGKKEKKEQANINTCNKSNGEGFKAGVRCQSGQTMPSGKYGRCELLRRGGGGGGGLREIGRF